MIFESILNFFSHAPYAQPGHDENVIGKGELDKALFTLEREIPDFSALVSGKRVIDFGCGRGLQSIALAKKYNCCVVGVDTNEKTLAKAKVLCKYFAVEEKCCFVSNLEDVEMGCVDIVLSHDSFEHFSQPEAVLAKMKKFVDYNGAIIITFGPPWLAPYGSHMHFFCNIPWANILFSEKTIMKVRSRYVDDGATRFEDVESGLNKMTLKKFETVIEKSTLIIKYKKYTPVRSTLFFSKIPFFREFFVNHVTVILSKNDSVCVKY